MSFQAYVKAVADTPIQFPQLKAMMLAQSILESGRENTDLAKLHNNHHGLKYRPEMAGFATPVEYKTDSEPTGSAVFCKFESKEAEVKGYWHFISRSPYKGWEAYTNSPLEYLMYIGPIYCPPGFTGSWIAAHGGLDYAQYIVQRLLPVAQYLLDNVDSVDVPAEPEEPPTPPTPPTSLPTKIPFATQFDCKMKVQGKYPRKFPEGLIVHYTAGLGTARGTNEYCAGQGYTLMTIGKDGELVQSSPLDSWGYHCGNGFQDTCLGIEITCAGRLEKKADGKFWSWFDTEIPKENVRHIDDTDEQINGYYEKYTPEQEATLIKLCLWLRDNGKGIFKLENVIGHDESCSRTGDRGRKSDPGGSLSSLMPAFRTKLKTL